MLLERRASRFWVSVSLSVVAVVLASETPRASGQEGYQAGVARVDITPDYPIRLNGFGGRRLESEGVGQKIWAKALAISTNSQKPIVLLTVDNLGLRADMVAQLTESLAQSHEIPRENVVVTFTHSHCAPKLDGASDTIFSSPIPPDHQQHITRYTNELQTHLIDVARRAIDSREPAVLSWSTGKVEFAMNRRTPGGPVDHSLPVLFVHSHEGDLRAVYTTYACHCVTLSYNKIHGDWAGCAQDLIERAHPGATALVSIGCGSDANPDSGVTGGQESIAIEQGGEIAAEVERLLAGTSTPINGPLLPSLQFIELPLQDLPTRQHLEELAKESSPAGYNASWQLKRWDQTGQLMDHLDYPIQTLRFGDDLAMVFLAGEVCVDYVLRLRQELDAQRLWVHGYSNDFCAYIPSERLLREGGYGGGAEVVYFALPAMLASGLEEAIIGEIKRQLPKTWHVDPGTQGVPPREPQEALRQFQLSPELEIQLVACEPQVQDPVAIDFGPDGRLWVVEMADYARQVDEEFSGNGRLKVLQDTDGDGFFESATVFLEGLRFPTDVKVWRDGVLVCDAPDIVYCRDTDGDGRADERQVLLTGFATHNPHARVNSLRWGLDGWVYGSCGLFGGTITNEDGEAFELNGRDFRWKPTTGEVQAVTGTTQQGRDRDDWNRWFGCDNGTLLRSYPIEDRYLRRGSLVAAPPTQISPLPAGDSGQLFPAGPLVLFQLSGQAGRPTSACGLSVYRDTRLGPSFAQNTFTCEPVNQLVHRRQLVPQGAELVALRGAEEQSSEFLTSTDRWFRPVQTRTGPDGGLWIVDIYRYVIEHPQWIPEETRESLNVFAGQDRGRIYRVLKRGESPREWPRVHDANDAELLQLLADRNGTVRDLTHQQLVVDQRRDLGDAINQVAMQAEFPEARGQALAVGMQLGTLSLQALLQAMQSNDPNLRRWAVRCSEETLAESPVVQAVIAALSDTDPGVRRQAIWTLGLADNPDATQALIEVWPTAKDDPVSRRAILMSLNRTPESTDAWLDEIFAGYPDAPEWLDRELLDVAFASMSLGRWSELFEQTQSRIDSPESLLVEPRFQALLAAPLQLNRLLLDPTETVELENAAANWLRKKRDLDPNTIACCLDVLVRLHRSDLTVKRDRLDSKAYEAILELVDSRVDVAVQRAIVVRIAADVSNVETWEALLLRLKQATPQLQTTALESWLARKPGRDWWVQTVQVQPELIQWMSEPLRDQWLELVTDDQRQVLEHLFDAPTNPQRDEVIDAYSDALLGEGQVASGHQLFVQHCAKCHRFGSDGEQLGPDLGALGNKTPRSLLVSILDPSRDIDARYRNVVIETIDGLTVVGLLLEESGSSIRLQLDSERQQTILRAEVETLSAHAVSFMPQGLEKELNVDQMRDLIAYLMSAQPGPKRLPGNEPRVVRSNGDGQMVLPASQAEIYGGDITFEQPLQNIGWWHGSSDYAVWQFVVEQPGTFHVALRYACADGSAGNQVQLSVADHVLAGRVETTGGWDRFQDWVIGTVELSAGELRLSVEPGAPLQGALMDLQQVVLRRVEEPK